MLSYNVRLQLIAEYFAAYKLYVGEVTVSKLEAWLEQELGRCDGGWHNFDGVLHIVSGNTNHAGLQSVLRALLVGGQHGFKLPSEGADEVESCLRNLPAELQLGMTWSRELNSEWFTHVKAQANLVVAYGSDETMAEIESQLSCEQIFIPHGHKVGMAYVDMTAAQAVSELSSIAQRLVADVVAFDQQGCLSLQVVYVKGTFELRQLLAQELAAKFVEATQELFKLRLRPDANELVVDELSRLAYARAAFELKTLLGDSECQLWSSDLANRGLSKGVWTVALDDHMMIEQLVGHCWLWVKPWDEDIQNDIDFLDKTQLSPTHLSSLAIYPHDKKQVTLANYIFWDRICALGELQSPPLNWQQGKRYNLKDLILA